MLICVSPSERRIEAGTVWRPSGGEMRIRASSKSGEFAGEVTAVLHVHPNKCGKERLSWEAEMKRRGTSTEILSSHIDRDLCRFKKKEKSFAQHQSYKKTQHVAWSPLSGQGNLYSAFQLSTLAIFFLLTSFWKRWGSFNKLYPLKWANCVQLTSLDATALTS